MDESGSARWRRRLARFVGAASLVDETAERTRVLETRLHDAAVDEGAHFHALAQHLDGLSRQVETLLEAAQRHDDALDALGARLARTEALASGQVATQQAIERVGAAVERTETAASGARASIAALALSLDDLGVAEVADGPLVSVIIPVRDRADVIERAVVSVGAQRYQRWECVVVDDGSSDGSAEVVERIAAGDDRIRVVRGEARGEGAARNTGIADATGDVVAFLDSDNEMLPGHLARLVARLGPEPSLRWCVAAAVAGSGAALRLLDAHGTAAGLRQENWVDTNMMAIGRGLLDDVGGFDEDLNRFTDWDLAIRLHERAGPPLVAPLVGTRYHDDRADRVTVSRPGGPGDVRVRTRHHLGGRAAGLRVLLAEHHYPQVTETYMEADVVGLRRLGAHVEVFSDTDVAVPYDVDVRVHRGELADAIGSVRPDLVLTHWANIGAQHRPTTRSLGVPHVVRVHGFEVGDEHVLELLGDPGVVVHAYPRLASRWGPHPRLVTESVAFDDQRYAPVPLVDKDRSLVVRVVAALRTKDLETFAETAKRCPDHRFVLVLGTTARRERLADELTRALAAEGVVEVKRDLDHDQCADLVRRAGLYLHTHGTAHPFGQSISLVESMAVGTVPIARDLPGIETVLGPDGLRYGGATVAERAEHAATLVHQTTRWSEGEWQRRWVQGIDRAHAHHAAALVADRMVGAWERILGIDARGSVAST